MFRRILALATIFALAGCAQLDTRAILDGLGTAAPLDNATVIAGLKQALEVGTERTVGSTSTVDGFLGNALIRLAVPEQFDEAADLLRRVGFGGQVDELELSMNRAAELASGEARGVFWDAIRGMSIADGFAILGGPEDAATVYFRDKTESELRRRFAPIVRDKMGEAGLYRKYEEITDIYNSLPLVEEPALDLEAHVTDGALDGLFTVLAQEEKRIREDPVARTTDLLKRVFGSRDGGR